MWGEVLGWALLASVNPLLLGYILIVLSRPRPVQNLFALWVGCLTVNLPAFLVPLVLLHMNPKFESFAQGLTHPATAAGSTFQPIPLATGVLALLIAATMVVRLRNRQRANLPVPVGNTSVMVLDSNTPTADSPPLGRTPHAVARIGSTIRRLLARVQRAWGNGALWVSFVAGLGYFPPPPLVLIVDLAIVASGAAIGTQVSAAIVFVFTMLVVVEIILVSCVVAPQRTHKVLAPVNDWMQAHRSQVLITLFSFIGVWQTAAGLGII